jgi:hypothetical protein
LLKSTGRGCSQFSTKRIEIMSHVIAGTPARIARFPRFEPVETLYDYDGPLVFTVLDDENGLNLACFSNLEGDTRWYVVAPTSLRILERLKEGRLSLLESLDQPRCWLAEVDGANRLRSLLAVQLTDIPADQLPSPGTMLYPGMVSTMGAKEA